MTVHGPIDGRYAERLRTSIQEYGLAEGDGIALSSPGGDVEQAMLAGEILRAKGLVTFVGRYDVKGAFQAASCMGSCVLVLAGGVDRIWVSNSRLGLERMSSPKPSEVAAYLQRMGISRGVFDRIATTEGTAWLSEAESTGLGLTTLRF